MGSASRREQTGGERRRVRHPRARSRRSAPDLLVIGARRRSPMGKAFLGSVTQNLLLDVDVPVLVVKSPR